MIRAINYVALSLVLAALEGCAGYATTRTALDIEQTWQQVDAIESTIRAIPPAQAPVTPGDEVRAKAFATDMCISSEASGCEHRVLALLTGDAVDDRSGISALRRLLVAWAYAASACPAIDVRGGPTAAYIGVSIALQLDPKRVHEERTRSSNRFRGNRGVQSWPATAKGTRLLIEERGRALNVLSAVQYAREALERLEQGARACSRRQVKAQIATELALLVGSISSKSLTEPVTAMLVESSRDVPQAFRLEFEGIAKRRLSVEQAIAARLGSIADQVLAWSDSDDGSIPLTPALDELLDHLFEDASNGDRIARLLFRSHWAHITRLTSAEPTAGKLTVASRAASDARLQEAEAENLCAANALYLVRLAVHRVNRDEWGGESRATIDALLAKARRLRLAGDGCSKPLEFTACSTMKRGSREFYRRASSALSLAIESGVTAFEKSAGGMAMADVDTTRNVLAAQFAACLSNYLKSLESDSACQHQATGEA